MNSVAGFDNPYAIIGAAFLVIVLVLAVWTLLRPKRQAPAARPTLAGDAPDAEMEYLDSSHIISGPLIGRDGARIVREPPASEKR